MTHIDSFHNLPIRTISSPFLRVDFLAEAGPRLVRAFPAGTTTNYLAELPHFKLETPFGDFCFQGGHRLWHAPEQFPRTYIPDNEGLTVESLADGVALVGRPEALTNIGKRLEIRLDMSRPGLTLHHYLTNTGAWPVELAAWAITQLPLGGVAILPQNKEKSDPAGLLPNRHLALWPYTNWQDPRLHLENDYVLVEARPDMPPFKIGFFNQAGWLAYWHQGLLFCKRFQPLPGREHPDLGCNSECYTNHQFIELESLSPLCRLEPGQTVSHVEQWQWLSWTEADFVPAGLQLKLEQLSQ